MPRVQAFMTSNDLKYIARLSRDPKFREREFRKTASKAKRDAAKLIKRTAHVRAAYAEAAQ